MTFHSFRHRRLAQGAAPRNALGHHLSPRLTVSLTAVEFIGVVALAERLGIPAAAVMRRAVAAYIAKLPPQCPKPMEDAMTNSTHPKTLNGLQGDLLSGQWLSEARRSGAVSSAFKEGDQSNDRQEV